MKKFTAFLLLLAVVTAFAQSPVFNTSHYHTGTFTNAFAHPQLSGNQMLYSVTAFNTHSSDVYLLVCDTNATPAAGFPAAVPAVRVPSDSTGNLDFGAAGVGFGVGVTVVASATPLTYTNAGTYLDISVVVRSK